MAKTTPDQSMLQRAVKRLGPERVFATLDQDQRRALPYVWPLVARPKQLAPRRRWRWWLVQAGRGFGKTRSGSEWVRGKAKRMRGSIGAIVGQTPEEARKIQIEGPAGILACSPANELPEWRPALNTLRWPGPDGATATVYSGADPNAFRGPQFHWAWVDELAKMARAKESFDNLNFGLRLEYSAGDEFDRDPQAMITTTPRPIAVMRELIKKPNCVVTNGSTYENRANLAASFFEEMTQAYEGTRLGDQELKGLLLDDVPGALWQRGWFDRPGFHVKRAEDLKLFDLIAISIDPAVSDNPETSAETGIIAAGMWREGRRRKYHALGDHSLHGTPKQRVRAAIHALLHWEADTFVVETNNGGDWIPAAIAAEWELMREEPGMAELLIGSAPVKTVTASRGKHTRAEPISTMYEQLGTVSHEPDVLEALEDQLVTWSPLLAEKSPDRLDALVWAMTYLSTAKVFVGT
jgi:phage terminase large subunit-like protein